MAKPAPAAPAPKVALYDAVISLVPGVARKGAKNVYTSHNGHMYSFLTPDGSLALRFGKTEREAFLKKFNTTQPVMYNTVMKEYVLVPDRLLRDTIWLEPYFAQSLAYVTSLKPKATTRKPSKGR